MTLDELQARMDQIERQLAALEKDRRGSWLKLRQGLLLVCKFIERRYLGGNKNG